MELEKEISQKKFVSEYHKAVVNFIFTNNWLTNILKDNFDRHDITMQQYNILRILRGQHPKPSTVNLLKERMLDRMCDASRIVERLVQKGLVSRKQNTNDRRAVDIHITPTGLTLLETIDKEEHPAEQAIRNNLSIEETHTLNTLLDKLRG